MNRTQKNAWFGLGFSLIASLLLLFIFGLCLNSRMPFQTFPWIFGVIGSTAICFVILLLCSFILRKRRSNDIEADERDQYIMNQAIKISFIAVWPALILANVLTFYFAGVAGPVPTILFSFIHLGVFIVAATVYFSSILILSHLSGKLLQNHEYRQMTEGGAA